VIETKFQELGGEYSAGDDWNSKVCVAGKLATGQNPQSSEALAQEVVKLLAWCMQCKHAQRHCDR
jgi:putative intracellular protease/amidase